MIAIPESTSPHQRWLGDSVTSTVQAQAQAPSPPRPHCLRAIFEQVGPQSCPQHYNFHLHTTCSDGQLTPATLMEQAVAVGLSALAITDHHSVAGFHAAQAWSERWRWSHPTSVSAGRGSQRANVALPKLFCGIEITAYVGDTRVHLLGYDFDPDHRAMVPYLRRTNPQGQASDAAQVIQAIHQAGGLAVLAHPCRYRQPAEVLIPAAAQLGIDGVETYYAYANPNPWEPCAHQTALVEALARQCHLLTTCGTDSHGPSVLRRI